MIVSSQYSEPTAGITKYASANVASINQRSWRIGKIAWSAA